MACFLRQVRRLELLAQFLHLGRLLVSLAQLLLDRLHLLAQKVLALNLLYFGPSLFLDLGSQLKDLQLLGEKRDQPLELGCRGIEFEQILRFLKLHALVVRDRVRNLQGVFQPGQGRDQLTRDGGYQLGNLSELVANISPQGLDLQTFFNDFVRHLDPGSQIGIFLDEFANAESRKTLDHNPYRAIGRTEKAVNYGCGSNRVEIIWTGRRILGVLGGDQANRPLPYRGIIHELDRSRLANGERDHGLGVNDNPAQRQDRQHFGDRRWRLSAVLSGFNLRALILDLGDDGPKLHLLPLPGEGLGDEVNEIRQVVRPAGCRHGHATLRRRGTSMKGNSLPLR